MTRDAFEQLLSEWLATPDDPALRTRISDACAGNPAFARLRDDWLRDDLRLRAFGDEDDLAERVDWDAFAAATAAHVAASVDSADDERFDSLLAATRSLDEQPDWSAIGSRFRGAVHHAARQTGRRRIRLAGVGLALAAAVALWLVLTPRMGAPTADSVMPTPRPIVAMAHVSPSPAESVSAAPPHVAVEPPTEDSDATGDGELYLVIAPPSEATAPDDSALPIGF